MAACRLRNRSAVASPSLAKSKSKQPIRVPLQLAVVARVSRVKMQPTRLPLQLAKVQPTRLPLQKKPGLPVPSFSLSVTGGLYNRLISAATCAHRVPSI